MMSRWKSLCGAAAVLAVARTGFAQVPASRLIAEARAQLDSLHADSAAALLRQALAPGSGASAAERARGLVLFGVTELLADRTLGARQAFREALRIDPALQVDSLGHLHSELVGLFGIERAALPAPVRVVELTPSPPRGAPTTLELHGLPSGARLRVDGIDWASSRQEVRPGVHRLEIRASGYRTLRTSVVVDSGAAVVHQVSLLRRRWELTVMPTVVLFGSQSALIDQDSNQINFGKIVLQGPVVGVTYRVSYRASDRFWAGLTFDNSIPGDNFFSFGPTLRWHLRQRVLGHYLLASYQVTGYRRTVAGPSMQAGYGVRYSRGGGFTVQAEGRIAYEPATHPERDARGTMVNFIGSFGVSYLVR